MGTVYSRTVNARSCTYFIDVDQDQQGKKSLVITAARMTPEAKQHIPVINIPADSVSDFAEAISLAIKEIRR